jgi:Arc/MetJ family transcription regulator
LRTTINLDDELLEEARRVTGIEGRTALVHEGLRALIERDSARRLARLGGSEARLRPVPRRLGQRASTTCLPLPVAKGRSDYGRSPRFGVMVNADARSCEEPPRSCGARRRRVWVSAASATTPTAAACSTARS